MYEETIEKLDYYLEMFNHVRSKGLNDDAVAMAIVQEAAKDQRMEKMRNGKPRNGTAGSARPAGADNGRSPATAKQREYLADLGVNARPDLTKQEASALLDELTAKQGA